MKSLHFRLSFVLLLAACSSAPEPRPATAPTAAESGGSDAATVRPPVAKREPVVSELHGVRRVDEYAWLRKKGAPEVEQYLHAENAYTDEVMKPTQALQNKLYEEMLSRIQQTDVSVPYRKGGWLYYSRTEEGKNYPILTRRRSEKAAEQVLVDLNALGKTHRFVDLGAYDVSDDGHLLAYTLDTTGFREYTLQVKDLRNGTHHPEKIEKVSTVAWAADNRHLFYTVEDSAKRSYRLYRHALGTPTERDPLLYEEKDARFMVGVGRTRSGGFLVMTVSSHTTSEAHVLDATRPLGTFRRIAPRIQDQKYYVAHAGNRFFIITNDAGRNFRAVTAPVRTPDRPHWKEIIPHRADVMLEDIDVFEGFLVRHERKEGLQHLYIAKHDGSIVTQIPISEPVYSLAGSANEEFKTRAYRYRLTSFVTPATTYEYNLDRGTTTLLKQQPVPGGYDASRYEQERLFAIAADGTRIPISLVRKKGAPNDGSAPLVLSGYGSYGYAYGVSFSSRRLSLLDRGVGFAIAHIRGGGDLGKGWHDAGRMMNKKNTFTDFISAAEFLISQKHTRSDRLAIEGRSAGGLLMGAVVNMRPDLFRVVIAGVPFLDVVNTMLDESLPLTVGEFEEWGNPKEKAAFDYMLSYSPYDNLERRAYPSILVESAYNDSQVMYFEPAKWVAKLRTLKTDDRPLLLRMLMEPAGHGGRSGRYDQLREAAFTYAFILTQLGVEPASGPGGLPTSPGVSAGR